MSARGWVTLGIRLAGLGFVIFGAAKLVAAVEASWSSPIRMMRKMSEQQPDMAGALEPSYAPTLLWVLLGLALIALSSAVTRLLFVGLERQYVRAEPRS